MKSYTSLEQSKKLTEILSLESADMYYPYFGDNKWGETARFGEALEYSGKKDIPCWSLATLLSVIPSEIFSGEYIINITEGLDNKWCITYDNIDNKNHSFYGLSSSADNIIDACYEIILELHERKLL